MLFNKARQYNISVLCTASYYVITFLYNFCQATVSIKIINLRICFCSFDFFVLYLKKIFLSKTFILYCHVLLNSVLFNLVCFDHYWAIYKGTQTEAYVVFLSETILCPYMYYSEYLMTPQHKHFISG